MTAPSKLRPGRPRVFEDPLRPTQVRLTDKQWTAVRKYGGGSISHGIRRMIKALNLE